MPTGGRAHLPRAIDPNESYLIEPDLITVPDDYPREDVGDVGPLGDDLKAFGVLQPIITDENLELLGGLRRLTAARSKSLHRVPVKVVECANDPAKKARLRQTLDLHNKSLTRQEKDRAADSIRAAIAAAAAARQEDSRAKAGRKVGAQGGPNFGPPLTPAKNRDSGKTNRIIAKVVGKSHETIRKREAVLKSGYQDLVDEMKVTGKIDPAYKEMVARDKAAEVGEPPPADDWAQTAAAEISQWIKALDVMERLRNKKAKKDDARALAATEPLDKAKAALTALVGALTA